MKSTILSAAIVLLFAAQSQAQWKVERTDQGLQISEGARKVFFYQRAMKTTAKGTHGRANYLHPLYDLRGAVLTEDFPKDHPHHRGIFWAWHQIWIGKKKVGDPWATVATNWSVRRAKTRTRRDGTLVLATVADVSSSQWKINGQVTPYMTERCWIRVHPARDGHRSIDFDIHLQALVDDLKIGGSDNDKGYGGFSARIRLVKGMTFRGQGGNLTPIRTAVAAGPWMDLSGPLNKDGSSSGMSILVHPSSPGFPQGWLLRTSRSMQNPAYPGQHPVAIPRDRPLKLRYRLVLHEGRPKIDEVNRWQAEFAATRPLARPASVGEPDERRLLGRLRDRIRRIFRR